MNYRNLIRFSIAVIFLSGVILAEGSKSGSKTDPEETKEEATAESAPIPAPQPASPDEWQTSAVIYLWMLSLSGTATVGPFDVPFDIEFKDAVSRLKLGFMGHFETTKNNWGAMIDFNFVAIGGNDVIQTPTQTADFNLDTY